MKIIHKIIEYFRKNPHLLILLAILLIGLFFRTYAVISRFNFAHDGDLYSWIVKDIVVNHHPRLLGQLTSAAGIFIGPAYYYLIVPFFLLTNMNPVGAIIPITIIGLLTIFSYYWIFAKLFNKNIGLIATFLYATLLSNVEFDRRVVPSTPTNIWVVWYFYTVIMICRGNFQVLPLLGILIGLIWHIHIALLPSLVVIPVAMLIARELPTLKQFIQFLVALVITSLPLLLFETRHGFSQTISLFNNFTTNHGGSSGPYKLYLVLKMVAGNIHALMFSPQYVGFVNQIPFFLVLMLSGIFFAYKKLISWKELICLYVWVMGVITFFTLSSSPISEYYFYSIEITVTLFFSLLFYLLIKTSPITKYLVLILFIILVVKNVHFYITQEFYHKGYIERKGVADFISNDAKQKGYPCVSIAYITSIGENVGFRYFFWLNRQRIVKQNDVVPVYTIVLPDEYSLKEVTKKFGHIGIIPPKQNPTPAQLAANCQADNINETGDMFGYVE